MEAEDDDMQNDFFGSRDNKRLNFDLFDRKGKRPAKSKSTLNKKQIPLKSYNTQKEPFYNIDRIEKHTTEFKPNVNKREIPPKPYNNRETENYDLFDRNEKRPTEVKKNVNKREIPPKPYNNRETENYDFFDRPNKVKTNVNKREIPQKSYNNTEPNYFDLFDRKEKRPAEPKANFNKKELPQKPYYSQKEQYGNVEFDSPDKEEYDDTYYQVKKLKENLIKNDKKENKNKYNIPQKNKKRYGDEEDMDEEKEEETEEEEEIPENRYYMKNKNINKDIKNDFKRTLTDVNTKYNNFDKIKHENFNEMKYPGINKEKNDRESEILPYMQNMKIQEKEHIEETKPRYVEQKKKISDFEMINKEPALKHFESNIRRRYEHYKRVLGELERNEQSLINFAKSYETMGVHVQPNGDITYREYAPGCKGVALYGEFNNWKTDEFWAIKDSFGRWELIIKSDNGHPRIKHGQKIKVNVVLKNNSWVTRNPIWSRYLIQNKSSFVFDTVFWNPEHKYQWKYPKKHMSRPKTLRVYECHVGMATKEQKVGSYREFADNIIPRLKKIGYNAVQLMAIMEHADYASFGYHVNNIFAISSRFGTPEDLMYLIDTAHEKGIFVIMDIVHSHASNNVDDGFNRWDGTDYLYFHAGAMGKHSLWDSRLYNYSSYETLRLLLSNCAFFIDVYHFDGFRFDGITSILYKNHGINYAFSGGYHEYYGDNFDEDGGVYLMLANKLIHDINPDAITIAEDVSGMPGLCRPVEEGGFGFDYRLNMSVCDKWIQLLKEYSDEDWNMGNIVFTLTNRRYNEKHIGYAESHDQSIVGDKTISMWLFDKEIYWNMANNAPETPVINRGFALHKMIRMITFALGGEGYLCFMGNEFGHPEWVDFPRPGNGFSYAHCCRRWDLCDNGYLRYKYLYNWDIAMNRLDEVFYLISSPYQYVSTQHEKDKVIVFEKGDLLFVFNFHPTKSFENYKIGTKWKTEHRIILDSDEEKFFGKGRLKYGHDHRFPCLHSSFNKRPYSMNVYIPSRTCMILIAEENEKKYDLNEFEKYNSSLFF